MGKQNFHNSTLQLASLYSRIPLLVVGASSVHAVRGLICTRGPGPRLYTRNGFALCTTVFLQLCIYVCKSKVPTHPSQLIRRPECMQVQGMLSSHPPQPLHQPTQWCPCMKSYLKVCVCVHKSVSKTCSVYRWVTYCVRRWVPFHYGYVFCSLPPFNKKLHSPLQILIDFLMFILLRPGWKLESSCGVQQYSAQRDAWGWRATHRPPICAEFGNCNGPLDEKLRKAREFVLQLVCAARYFLPRDQWQQGTPSVVAVAACCNDTQVLSTAAVIVFALHRCLVSHHVHYIIYIYTSEWTDNRRWCMDTGRPVKSCEIQGYAKHDQFSVWWIFLPGPGEGAAFGRCSGQDVSGVRQAAERGLLWNTRFLRHETQAAAMVSMKQQEEVKRNHRFL